MRSVVAAASHLNQCEVALQHDDLGFRGDTGQAEAGRQLARQHDAALCQHRLFGVLHDDTVIGFNFRFNFRFDFRSSFIIAQPLL